MSTHQMHQVEELCDRILLVNRGRDVLYGKLDEIRSQYASHAVMVRSQQDIPELPGEIGRERANGAWMLRLDEETSPQDMLRKLVSANIRLDQFEIAAPSLDEIFIQVVAEESADGE
jgi:ABC-2 type transport system ATP-binding protein